jgi:dTDP-4-amino-4,6-dideoxygalactose transaminase
MVYKELEKKYAKFCGSKYAVSCNSGTSALHLALIAIGIKKGDEVIIPDFTMVACGYAVEYCGATPVFVDCDDTLCMNWKLIEEKITPKTKAIMPVHIYGRLCNMKEILRIAKKHKLKVIEDACEAQGAVYKSKADITCYSFYENKIIHAEEGGICTTDNKKYADDMADLKNMAFGKKHDYFHKRIGYNYRMPNSQAQMALESLKNYPEENKRRRKLEKQYAHLISKKKRDAVWVLDTIYSLPNGYDTRLFFKPLSSMPMWGGKCQSLKALYYSKIGKYIKI